MQHLSVVHPAGPPTAAIATLWWVLLVYIIFLPAAGVISTILPVMARPPLLS